MRQIGTRPPAAWWDRGWVSHLGGVVERRDDLRGGDEGAHRRADHEEAEQHEAHRPERRLHLAAYPDVCLLRPPAHSLCT